VWALTLGRKRGKLKDYYSMPANGGPVEDPFRTIEWKGDHIRLLDQTRLPLEETYLEIKTVDELCEAIRRLSVRGAPAIGVAAAMGVALGVIDAPEHDRNAFRARVEAVTAAIRSTRPTAVNLFWALDRMDRLFTSSEGLNLRELKDALAREAVLIEEEDRRLCEAIGAAGRDLISDGDVVLTHCNAGGAATAGYGTALGVIRSAYEQGKRIQVIADETRPLCQGARITTWELMKLGIPVTLIPDNTAGALMKRGEVHKVVVGADRIAANGDTANKIGTYSVAVLSRFHGVPFYVAAPLSTVDMSLDSGAHIPIEERDPREVTHLGGTAIAPPGVKARNIAFDVTPARLITSIITEKGAVGPPFESAFRAFFSEEAQRS
jgi:methylthioribose-1-phosphate isomerase